MTDILKWLSDRMSRPPEPRSANFTKAPSTPMTPRLKLRVGAMYYGGAPLKIIAADCHCHIETVSKIRRELGLPLRQPIKAARISAVMRGKRR